MDLKSVFDLFSIEGKYLSSEPYGNGHINDTFRVSVSRGDRIRPYLMQRINTGVFEHPEKLMDNIGRICAHLRNKLQEHPHLNPDRNALTLIPSTDGNTFVRHESGFWRCYLFIENALGFDVVETEKQAFEAARAFGSFQNLLSDLPGRRLYETIPDFHNTPRRFDRFKEILRKDPLSLAREVREETEFFLSLEDEISYFTDRLESGELPERVTHNDTKLNNVLIDTETDEAVCVIDLDTSMPGLAAYDFGDLVRTSTCLSAEDEKDLSKVVFQKNMFESLVRGYLSAASDFLTENEVKSLVFGSILMTYEVGMRFLTDYLEGSVYFKSRYPEHNLVRSRTQIALAKALIRDREALEELTESVYQEMIG